MNTAEFRQWGKRSFALWYCPYSGIGDCWLHIYFFDYEKNQWVQFKGEYVEAGGDLKVELPQDDTLVVHNSDGKVLRKVSLAGAPTKPQTPATQP